MTIARNLKAARVMKGESQLSLSKDSGVSQAQISSIENGLKKNPGIYTVRKLADALGISVDELLKEENE
ncbi:HTH-type transcriptional regulator [Bacillus phage vB_BpsM-61]|nr:HTH-type transcriptional regulator [Bacillus phage vB_BpsM-61]